MIANFFDRRALHECGEKDSLAEACRKRGVVRFVVIGSQPPGRKISMGQTACVGSPNAYEYVVPLFALSLKNHWLFGPRFGTIYPHRRLLVHVPMYVEVSDRIFIDINDAFAAWTRRRNQWAGYKHPLPTPYTERDPLYL